LTNLDSCINQNEDTNTLEHHLLSLELNIKKNKT